MTRTRAYALLGLSTFGLFVPNGMFLYYVAVRFVSPAEVLNDLLALGFIIDAFMATGIIAWWLAKNPMGKYSWKLFIVLSLAGGLGFSLPFFCYLNSKDSLR